MALYNEFEVKTSRRYLKQIIDILDEPICLLGGWAVYLTVNKNFMNEQGRSYIGSRDIDIGFHIDRNYDENQLEDSAIAKSIRILEKEGFKLLGFRYYKEIHYETGEELTIEESRITPTYNIFTIYIDPVVDSIHPLFKKIFGFMPVDEPLLSRVFTDEKCRIEIKEFDKILWLPIPEILLATKIKSLPNRTRDEKIVKDICDIYALSWYSTRTFNEIKREYNRFLATDNSRKLYERIQLEKELFDKAEVAIGVEAETIQNLIKNLISSV